MDIIIRNEVESDADPIAEVTKAAFADCPYSEHSEQFIIAALRKANALTISMVAEVERQIVAHIAFSPVTISDGSFGWYGLGPLSVLPRLQRRGIGYSLMREGLSALKTLGAQGCVLVGDPSYYERFGFKSVPNLLVAGVPQQNVLVLPFTEARSSGMVVFQDAFAAKG